MSPLKTRHPGRWSDRPGRYPRPTPKSTVDMSRSQSAERSSAGLGWLIGGGAGQIDDVGLVGTGELILGVAGQVGLAG